MDHQLRKSQQKIDTIIISTLIWNDINCGHTMYEAKLQPAAHNFDFQGTSVLSSKALLGMPMQCYWYQGLHTSRSAILSPTV